MTISVTKSIPSSSWYSGTGSVTINLDSSEEITVHTKKALIKIQIPQSNSTQQSTPSDKGKNYIKDLKRVEDEIKIRGWIADGTTSETSAWNKAWQLRGMCSSGGPLSSLIIEDLTFGTGSQQAYLEDVTFISNPHPSKRINQTSSSGIARIEVDMAFYLGDER